MSRSAVAAPGGDAPPREADDRAGSLLGQHQMQLVADVCSRGPEAVRKVLDLVEAAHGPFNEEQQEWAAGLECIGDGVGMIQGDLEAGERLQARASEPGLRQDLYDAMAGMAPDRIPPRSEWAQSVPRGEFAVVACVSRRPERRSSRKAARKAAGTRRRSSSSGGSSSGGDSDKPGDPSPSAEQPQLPDGSQEHDSGIVDVGSRWHTVACLIAADLLAVTR